MDFLQRYLHATAGFLTESAPFLLVGFAIAGLLKAWVPAEWVAERLGAERLRSVFLAALYGLPIPLCSCSVIPTATALRRSGASRGATTSFLVSTPETGVDSISVTWALMDPLMTVLRPLVAFATAVSAGAAVMLFGGPEREGASAETAESTETARLEGESASCCGTEPEPEPAPSCCSAPEPEPAPSCCSTSPPERPAGSRFMSRVREGLAYATGKLLDDLAPWLLIGFLVSGLVATIVPDDLFASEAGAGGVVPMLLMLLVGTPLYVCATASTPIAAALVAKGLSPGAALVFLLVGPATNVTTMLVVLRLFGRRVLGIYLASVALVALAAGLGVDRLYAWSGVDLAAKVQATVHDHDGPFAWVAAAVLIGLILRSLWRTGAWSSFLRRPAAWLGWSAQG